MIRYLDNREKGLTKELWREAFPEDSEDFLDYYDHEKMKENHLTIVLNGAASANYKLLTI